MQRPKAGTTVLREPAQSKCIWTSLRSKCYARIFKENAAPQDRANRFARACAWSWNAMGMSREPFYASILKENAAPQRRDSFAQACAIETHLEIAEEPISRKNSQGKCRRLCASLLSGNANGYLTRDHKSNFAREFAGNTPEARWSTLTKHWSVHIP